MDDPVREFKRGPWWSWSRFQAFLRTELGHLTTVHASDRPWQMPLAAALASGLPLMVGAWFNRLDYGLASSLGGLVFLFVPRTALHHRMVTLMACAFGMSACYALGLMSHFYPALMALSLAVITLLATMVCRFYAVGPPGSFFFVMAAAIGAHMPIHVPDFPLYVGLFTLGCVLACLIAFGYSLWILRLREPAPIAPLPAPTFDFVVFDSVVIGVFVGGSVLVAQALGLQRAYWVPVSCLAVIAGATLRAVWDKQLQRILGTALGLLLAWGFMALPFNPWLIAAMVMVLTFIIETLVVRHYGVAAVFITPLTLLLAEAAAFGQQSTMAVLQARFVDIVLGSVIGLVGGACIHSPRFRAAVSPWLRRLAPQRLLPPPR